MQRLENLETRPDSGPLAGARPLDVRWKRALRGVVDAAFRLHYYRFVRTRMLHDALSTGADTVEAHGVRPGRAEGRQ